MATRHTYRHLFWPVYAPSTLLGVAAGATVPIQVVAAMQLGASASAAASIVAVVGAVQLLTTIHAGRLIDRLGDRRAMLAASVWAGVVETGSVAALVWGHPEALALFVATTVLRAPATNVWSLARQAFVADHVDPALVGRAMTGLGGTMRVGTLVGPLLGGLLLLRWPLWSVYVLSVACATLALLVLYVPSLGGRLDGLPTTAPAPATTDTDAARADRRVDWTRVTLAGIAITCLAVTRVSQPVVVQLWGVHIGLSGAQISLVVAAGAAVEIAVMFPGGYLKDRLGRVAVLTTCLAVYGAGLLLVVPLTAALGAAGLVVAVLVMALGNGLGAGINMTIAADLSPTTGRGRFLGVWAVFSNVGSLGGPLLLSALVHLASVTTAVPAVGAVALTGAAWTLLVSPRLALPGPTRPPSPAR